MTDQTETVTCPYCPHPAHRPGVECEGGVDHGPKHWHRCLCLNKPFSGGSCHPLMDCQGGKLGYSDIWHLQRGHSLSSADGPVTPDVLKTAALPSAVPGAAADRVALVCKFDEGCHRVVACEPGCAVTATDMHAKLTAAGRAGLREQIAEAVPPLTETDRDPAEDSLKQWTEYVRAWNQGRDEVLAALGDTRMPASVDRAAVLAEVADRLERKAARLTDGLHDLAIFAANARIAEAEILDREAEELRRLAVEARDGQTPFPTPCGPAPDRCDAEAGEPCAVHEREQAHAEGEHCFCGTECDKACTCGSAGDAFVPIGHYADCPQATVPAVVPGGAGEEPAHETQAVQCTASVLRKAHGPHGWEPQPGMEPIPCVGYPQPEEADGDRIVAYRSALPGALSIYCTNHTDELGNGVMPLTSDDLPNGGVCASCGADVLIPQQPKGEA